LTLPPNWEALAVNIGVDPDKADDELKEALEKCSSIVHELRAELIEANARISMPHLKSDRAVSKMSELMAPALMKADPFAAVALIIENTVESEEKRKMLCHWGMICFTLFSAPA